MTTAYTTLLGLALPVQGELQGTWGDEVNNYITNYLDAAVAGTQTISGSQTAVTLSKTTGSSLSQAGSGATGSSQYFVINCTGNPAGTLTITAPAASKAYLIINATSTSQDVKIVGAGPTTGVTLVSGERAIVSWNGSDFVKVANFGGVGSFTTISATTGNITTVNATTVDTTNLEVTNIKAKDGTASMTLADATGVATFSANPILNAGTANGVLYLNGSKVATSSSAGLTYDGSNLGVGSAAGANARLFAYANDATLPTLVARQDGAAPIQVWQAGGSEVMRFTTGGNLGIGTSSPGAKLDVATTTPFTFDTTSTAGVKVGTQGTVGGSFMVQTQSASAGFGSGLAIDGTYAGAPPSAISTVNIKAFGVYSGGGYFSNLAFWTSSGTTLSQKMLLDSSGNLGLGVTPSAIGAGRYLQVLSTTSFGQQGNGSANVLCNAYESSTNAFSYVVSAAASRYNASVLGHQWFVSTGVPSAGSPISFTQAMTLDASGNLLIGATSSPVSTAKIYTSDGTITSFYAYKSGGVEYLGTSSNHPLAFIANNQERARITSGGYFKASNSGTYVGSTGSYHEMVSNTASNYVAWVRHAATSGAIAGININYSGQAPNDTANEFLVCGDTGANRFLFRSNGGLANYSGNNVNLSDRREKTNFAPAKSYLDTICAIPVQTFNYIDQSEDDPGLTLGVVAQDVQAVAPELVMESNWGTEDEPKMRLSIYQTDLQYALMKCIQELKTQNDELRARVAALEGV